MLSCVPGCHWCAAGGGRGGLGSYCRSSLVVGRGAGAGRSPTCPLSLSPRAGEGGTSTPLLGTATHPGLSGTCWPLESRGWFRLGDEFHCHPLKSTCGPWHGNPPRCVGRGGILGNLMFSTLTLFFVFKVGMGTAAKSGLSLPFPSLLPLLWLVGGSGSLVCRALLPLRQSPGWLSGICPLPTLVGMQPGSHLPLTDTFSERDPSGRPPSPGGRGLCLRPKPRAQCQVPF